MKSLGRAFGAVVLWSPVIVVVAAIVQQGGCQARVGRPDDHSGNPKYRSGPSVEDVVERMQQRFGGPGVSQSIDD